MIIITAWGIQTPYGLIRYENLKNKDMCYSWEDFETGCSPLYRPNGKESELSFSRKKLLKKEDVKSTVNKSVKVTLTLKDILDCQQQIYEHIKDINKILDTSPNVKDDIKTIKRELRNVEMEFIYLLEKI
jgi:hypothetical protein